MNYTNQQIKEVIEINDELENYFRNTIIPQLFVDADLILRKFTPPAMKQFNLSPENIGRSFVEIVNNIRFPSIIENIQQVINSSEILEKEIQTTDLKWYQMNIIPYISPKEKKTNGVIITFIEITRRVKDLKEQEKLISDHETLLDTISHDIRTPLTNLVVAVELFKNVSPENSQEFQSLLNMVEKAVNRMHSLIDELTETRMQKHKYKDEEEMVNFEHILEDVRFTLNDMILESGAIITSEINVSEIIFSRRKLRSIFYNLVSNAIKFQSPERSPRVLIRTSMEDDFIKISVKDNGKGIDANNQRAVFSKYFRLSDSAEGSGIGLFLIKEIINNSGGRIVLESTLDKGSEFIIYLKDRKSERNSDHGVNDERNSLI